MASYYYSANATSGTADGSSKANAFTSFATALTKMAAGDTLLCDKTSNEAVASNTTFTSPGTTPAGRVNIFSVDFTGSTPPAPADFQAGCTITAGASVNDNTAGYAYLEGILLSNGNASSGTSIFTFGASANEGWVLGPGCQILQNSNAAAGNVVFGTTASYNHRVTIRGSAASREGKFTFGHTGQVALLSGATVTLRNMLMLSASSKVPATLFVWNSAKAAPLDAEAVDFTGAGATLLGINTATGLAAVTASFRDCFIPTSVTALLGGSATMLPPGSRITFARCSTGAGAFSDRVIAYEGWQAEETGITLQGGATDNTTLRSWHLSTNTTGSLCGSYTFGAIWAAPFESQAIYIWNDQTGSALTVSLEGIWNGAAVPNNDDIWIEVEGETASGSSLAIPVSGTKAGANAANAALPSSSASWNNVGNLGSTYSQFRLQATITPQQKGWLKIVIKVAKASADFYVDPKPTISGSPAVSRSYVTPSGAMAHETATTVTTTVQQFVPVPGRRRPA